MKKIKSSYYFYSDSSILYLDEIEQIYNIFSEHFKQFDLVVNDYQLEKFEEIKEFKNDKIQSFKIITEEPYISLELGKKYGLIYCPSGDDLNALGIISKVKDILAGNINKLAKFGKFIFPVLLSVGGVIYLYSIIGLRYEYSVSTLLFVCYMILVGIVTPTAVYRGQVIIINKYRNETPSFFKRNKDGILVGLIVGLIVGFFITTIGPLITQHIQSESSQQTQQATNSSTEKK